MSVTNKTLIAAVLLLAITSLLFYFSPVATKQPVGLSNDIAKPDSQSAYGTKRSATALAVNIGQQAEVQADALASQQKAATASETDATTSTPLQKFTANWSLYLDKNSSEYQVLLDKYADSKDKVIVEGDTVYFKHETEQGIELTKLTREYRELTRHEPFNVYGMFLQQLNELQGYGDWSYDAELTVRALFSDYFTAGGYSINAMQCRVKTCLIEFSFADFELANNFVDYLRGNRSTCQCIPAETIWPELKQAVLKIDLL